MLFNPFDKGLAQRYPDETIVPTAMVHLASTTTFSVPTVNFVTTLNWKVTELTMTGIPTIVYPAPIGAPVLNTDYGPPQAAWAALDAIDRTLACGIRVTMVGLPTSSFMPSGTLYFLQVQQDELAGLVLLAATTGEEALVQAVVAGKGFSLTLNELNEHRSACISFLPQGPMSFLFSDVNSSAAASPTITTNVSSNPHLAVFGFGLAATTQLRFEYSHHIEYVPTVAAAGLIATRVGLPDMAAREGISRTAAMAQQRRSGATDSGALSAIGALGKAAISLVPGGSLLAGVARGAATALGAPQWMQTALGTLA